MSLHRVKQRLGRMLAEHEEGERDGHSPTAQAHATFAEKLREDIAAIDEAMRLASVIEHLDEVIGRRRVDRGGQR